MTPINSVQSSDSLEVDIKGKQVVRIFDLIKGKYIISCGLSFNSLGKSEKTYKAHFNLNTTR